MNQWPSQVSTDYPCSHGNGANRLILTWLACQNLSAPMRHLYSCRSYTYVRLYAIKLFMRTYRLDLLSYFRFFWLTGFPLLTVRPKSAVSMRTTLKTSNWVPILNKTLPRCESDKSRKLRHRLQSPLISVRLQPLDAVARAQHPAFQITVFKCTVHPLSRRQSDGMEAPEFRQDILKHYNAFKAVARECWQTFILW